MQGCSLSSFDVDDCSPYSCPCLATSQHNRSDFISLHCMLSLPPLVTAGYAAHSVFLLLMMVMNCNNLPTQVIFYAVTCLEIRLGRNDLKWGKNCVDSECRHLAFLLFSLRSVLKAFWKDWHSTLYTFNILSLLYKTYVCQLQYPDKSYEAHIHYNDFISPVFAQVRSSKR